MLRRKCGLGDPSSLPIFIVGMPRSGMALVEQILASIPNVFGGGETDELRKLALGVEGADNSEFPECFASIPDEIWSTLGEASVEAARRAAPNAQRITDKSAANFLLAGLISLMLPNARIIHVRRDARDLAVSCFSTLFARGHEYSYDLAELGRYIRAYRELMDHWRAVLPEGIMIDVRYEDLVSNFEQDARRIVSHCGLEWDDACLDFHKTERLVRSETPVQVRQPIYRTAIGRWQRYADHLQPLLHELQDQ
jgi:hypothetical protein